METALDAARAKERRGELLLTFANIIEKAAEWNARAILLVGDLFDTARATQKTRKHVGQLIAAHPELQFLYVSGNHDACVLPIFPEAMPPSNWVEFPADSWQSVPLGEDVVVSGTSDVGRADVYDTLPVMSDGFHIVMLHGQVTKTGSAAKDTVVLAQLKNRGIDYLALGHEHSFCVEPLDRRGMWCYCGCPEGRGFDECGEKGVVLLDTDGEQRVHFFPIAQRTLHRVPVAVDGCLTQSELLASMQTELMQISGRDMVRVVLVGEASPELTFDTEQLAHAIRNRYYAVRVVDETRLLLRPEDYVNDISLKGEFVRGVMASRLSRAEQERVIACGLRALRGEEAEI
jgi:DNA repair exonuclease SbcCD nuclease subunit